MHAEFDQYAESYETQHARSIRLSGEDPCFFARYKIAALKRLTDEWRLPAREILDFGAGIGNSLPAFREYFPESRIVSADVSPESLRIARETHGSDLEQLLIEDRRLPVPDASFGLVFTACVFHHIPEDEHVWWLSELRRVTRLDGRLVVFEHNPLNPFTQMAVKACPFDENAVLISAGTMRARMRQAGWLSPETEYHLFFPKALAALRPLEAHLRRFMIGAQYSCAGRAAA